MRILLLIFPLILSAQKQDNNYVQSIAGSDLTFRMVDIKGGEYIIGQSTSHPKKVIISDFWIGETEMAHDVFQLFLDESKDTNPPVDGITRPSPPYIDFTLGMGKTGGFPANSMQQYSALMFCKWLSLKTGIFYRLPTEAEWEYVAIQAYDKTDLMDSTKMQAYEVFAPNSGGRYQRTASLKPNKLGVYDLLGNVAEWTMDLYNPDYFTNLADGTVDPVNAKTKKHPTSVRGGHYNTSFLELSPTIRRSSDPIWNRRDPQIPKSKWWNADAPFCGFRIVRSTIAMTPEQIEAFFEMHLK